MTPFLKNNLRFSLKNKKILLGITGSIAAFKACDIVRYLRACGAEVRVILTQGATNFVTPTTLETLSGAPVLQDFWQDLEGHQGHSQTGTFHIATARWADLILVAPASAHFLAKCAYGFADDLLSTEILAFQGPLLVAPAMNPAMFAHPAVVANTAQLKARGVLLLGPTEGSTACGEEGLGRMLEPEEIVEQVAMAFRQPAKNKSILITLGPTRSKIDPVRFLSNRSSGLMGASLCWAAFESGFEVTAVCGPTEVLLPKGIQVIRVQTAREMADTALRFWPKSDIYIGTAAVLDWDIKHSATTKLKKKDGTPKLELDKNPDILALISQTKTKKQFVLGFAAETNDPLSHAFQKLKEKHCDALFVNDVSQNTQGFESDLNSGFWLTLPDQVTSFPLCTKAELARQLIEKIPS